LAISTSDPAEKGGSRLHRMLQSAGRSAGDIAMASIPLEDLIPDVRDGLTRKERMVLYCLQEAQRDFKDRNVPTITLYGRVLEKVDMSQAEFQSILTRMAGKI
jgi:hypothetical protein